MSELAYHWLQAAVYDVQLMGDLARQQELMPKVIAFYHGYYGGRRWSGSTCR